MAERYNCERCGETYHEENIDECVGCQRLVCPRCAASVPKANGKGDEWLCDMCRKRRAASSGGRTR